MFKVKRLIFFTVSLLASQSTLAGMAAEIRIDRPKTDVFTIAPVFEAPGSEEAGLEPGTAEALPVPTGPAGTRPRISRSQEFNPTPGAETAVAVQPVRDETLSVDTGISLLRTLPLLSLALIGLTVVSRRRHGGVG